MIEIDGLEILTALEEKVDPKHAAVVHIDMQKDFTTPGCFWDQLGQLDVEAMEGLVGRCMSVSTATASGAIAKAGRAASSSTTASSGVPVSPLLSSTGSTPSTRRSTTLSCEPAP
jgi:hypothetical protein